jgi:hypothetical protein
MNYAKIIDGSVARYPYSLRQLRLDNPQTSFPKDMPESLLAEYGVVPVTAIERPASTLTQDTVEQTPQFINGQWTQVWSMVDVSQEEAARRQQQATDEAEAAAVKEDAFVQSFVGMTPAQLTTYINANTGNLTQMRALVTKMALMLLVLAKREYR